VRPFARDSEVATLWAHVHEPPAPLQATRPELGDEIDEVMARALAKAPADRYGSCAELVAAARAALGLEERPAPVGRRSARRLRLPRGRLRVLSAAGMAVVAVAVVAVVLLLRSSDGLSGIAPQSVGVIDPSSGELVKGIPVGFDSTLIAAGAGFVWVIDPEKGTLTKIDPKTLTVVETSAIRADGIPIGLAAGEGSVWVAMNQEVRLVVLEIGPELGNVERSITIARKESGTFSLLRESVVLTTGNHAVWALERGSGEVDRIDPTSGKRQLTYGLGASYSIAVDERAIWLGGINGVNKLDPATGSELASTPVTGVTDSTAASVAIGSDSTWFTANARSRLFRIPPEGDTIDDSYPVGSSPNAVTVDEDGIVWVVSGDGTVSRLDPRQDSVETIELGVTSGGIVDEFGRVWTSPGVALRAG
jgi:streptogramin lyase